MIVIKVCEKLLVKELKIKLTGVFQIFCPWLQKDYTVEKLSDAQRFLQHTFC